MPELEVTTTIKYGAGYEAPWVVFRGTPRAVQGAMEEYFGLGPDSHETPHGTTLEAVALAQASRLAQTNLGAVPKKPDGTVSEPEVEAPAEESAEQPANNLRAAVECADSEFALKQLWRDNKAEFEKDRALTNAYRARGKALTVAKTKGVVS